MQGRGAISRGKLISLVIISIAAISSMMIAPEGAVGKMVAQVGGPENLVLSSPKPLPPLNFLDSQTKGKVVVANFWALWCAPCKVEKPLLDRLQADYAKKGLIVLAIADSSTDIETVRQYYAAHNITHLKPAKDQGGDIFGILRLTGLPTTLIINKNGQEIARAQGPIDWSDKEVRKILDEQLKSN